MYAYDEKKNPSRMRTYTVLSVSSPQVPALEAILGCSLSAFPKSLYTCVHVGMCVCTWMCATPAICFIGKWFVYILCTLLFSLGSILEIVCGTPTLLLFSWLPISQFVQLLSSFRDSYHFNYCCSTFSHPHSVYT